MHAHEQPPPPPTHTHAPMNEPEGPGTIARIGLGSRDCTNVRTGGGTADIIFVSFVCVSVRVCV